MRISSSAPENWNSQFGIRSIDRSEGARAARPFERQLQPIERGLKMGGIDHGGRLEFSISLSWDGNRTECAESEPKWRHKTMV